MAGCFGCHGIVHQPLLSCIQRKGGNHCNFHCWFSLRFWLVVSVAFLCRAPLTVSFSWVLLSSPPLLLLISEFVLLFTLFLWSILSFYRCKLSFLVFISANFASFLSGFALFSYICCFGPFLHASVPWSCPSVNSLICSWLRDFFFFSLEVPIFESFFTPMEKAIILEFKLLQSEEWVLGARSPSRLYFLCVFLFPSLLPCLVVSN